MKTLILTKEKLNYFCGSRNLKRMNKRGSFSSQFGAIAAATGSAIGLGNIWRFPYVVGENGGAAFILIYFVIILLLGVPLLISEFGIGRATHSNVLGAIRKVSPPKSYWVVIGYFGLLAAFIISAFYNVVAGWTLAFFKESLADSFNGMDAVQIGSFFDGFIASGWKPALWAVGFSLLTSLIVISGVEKGIERYNKVLMPLMLLILVALSVNSLSLRGLDEGVEFMFKPDFSKVTLTVILNAIGQAFFSLSVGMGCMITYGSYIRKSDSLLKTSLSVIFADVIIAMLAGIAIFPAVFSFGITPASGPDLVFKTLPNIFGHMTGGYVISILFFLLLVVAALTSSVSVMEVLVAALTEEFKMSRKKAVAMVTSAVLVTTVLCALSQMPDSALKIGGTDLFTICDVGSSTYMLPLNGLLIVILVGWFIKKRMFIRELSSNGLYPIKYYPAYIFIIKYIAPVAITGVFVAKLTGMI